MRRAIRGSFNLLLSAGNKVKIRETLGGKFHCLARNKS